MRRILDSHSRIHCGPEVKFMIDLHGDYRDDPHRHARFFNTAGALATADELLELFGGRFVELHERAARRAGKTRWADKNPENVLYPDAWRRLLGDRWLLVQVVRDPRDVICSMQEAGFPLALEHGSLEARIEHVDAYLSAGLRFAEAHPDRHRVVLYERLVDDPGAVVGALMRWLGESPERAQLDPASVQHEHGLEDPKAARRHRINADGVGRWRGEMASADATRIRSATRRSWEELLRRVASQDEATAASPASLRARVLPSGSQRTSP